MCSKGHRIQPKRDPPGTHEGTLYNQASLEKQTDKGARVCMCVCVKRKRKRFIRLVYTIISWRPWEINGCSVQEASEQEGPLMLP